MSTNPAFEGREGMEAGRGEHARGGTEELREHLGRLGETAKQAAYEQVEYLREAGLEKAHQLEDRIREQPLKSVLIAAGVGFVLGVIWMRR